MSLTEYFVKLIEYSGERFIENLVHMELSPVEKYVSSGIQMNGLKFGTCCQMICS